MAKKNKFKRTKKNKPASPSSKINNSVLKDAQEEVIESITRNEVAAPEEEKEVDPYKTNEYNRVQRDIKKILIIMTFIILALVGVYFLDTKTTILASLGNWIYKVVNIQAQ